MSALFENMIAAVGRENRANRIPVISARAIRPHKDSSVTSRLGTRPTGPTWPYPMVPKVWTLKKKARR